LELYFLGLKKIQSFSINLSLKSSINNLGLTLVALEPAIPAAYVKKFKEI